MSVPRLRRMGCLALVLASFAAAQRPAVTVSCPLRPAFAPGRGTPPGNVIREIVDESTGDRWLLVRNANCPAGPGRLVRVAASAPAREGFEPSRGQDKSAAGAGDAQFHPVIHSGDVLVVEERTAVVDARLEAVALGPAAVGSAFRARLKIGGRMVQAIALAAGRAELDREGETQP
ncbi:MAG TPA: hypothetical protein VMD29_01395 [Terracidiphilus sp.]|nr:hypothetical protein [Terracidiphilus sp.]